MPAAMGLFVLGTQGQVRNSRGKLAISVRATEVLLHCKTWKLTINTSKSKVVIFLKGRPKSNYCFYSNNLQLEIIKEYTKVTSMKQK